MHHEVSIDIAASPELIWSALSDVERWPEWTASVSAVERLDTGDFGVGSRARVKQPGMPGLVWEVTEYTPGEVFNWASKVPGVTTTGGHHLAPARDGHVAVTLSLDQEGFLAPVVSLLTGARSRRYVQMEADGLKRRSESGGA
ncbi:MAG TPA: SRPBCC family protein [Acidimicrobiales bacterium]|nr:SRPBCC family protein [Acidimicrobiales bacterium]